MTKKTPTFAEDFKALMDAWNKLSASVDKEFPNLSDSERYEIKANAMNKALGFDSKKFADSIFAGETLETARAKSRSSCSCDLCEQNGGCDDPNH